MCGQVVAQLPRRLKSMFLKNYHHSAGLFAGLLRLKKLKNIDFNLWGKKCALPHHHQNGLFSLCVSSLCNRSMATLHLVLLVEEIAPPKIVCLFLFIVNILKTASSSHNGSWPEVKFLIISTPWCTKYFVFSNIVAPKISQRS